MLMVAALRQSSAPTARKTQRHVTAFGTRVPPEIEEVRDFEVPAWVLAKPGADEDGQDADDHNGEQRRSMSVDIDLTEDPEG